MAKKTNDKLDAARRKKIPTGEFGIPSERKFPLNDAEHVHAAESYFRYASKEDKPALARKILQRADELGVEVKSDTIRDWSKK